MVTRPRASRSLLDIPSLDEMERSTVGSVVQEVGQSMAQWRALKPTKSASVIERAPSSEQVFPVSFEISQPQQAPCRARSISQNALSIEATSQLSRTGSSSSRSTACRRRSRCSRTYAAVRRWAISSRSRSSHSRSRGPRSNSGSRCSTKRAVRSHWPWVRRFEQPSGALRVVSSNQCVAPAHAAPRRPTVLNQARWTWRSAPTAMRCIVERRCQAERPRAASRAMRHCIARTRMSPRCWRSR